ncbi:MAG: hypothetical protein Fues2KO_26220 [Fuerstiella sp.]
MIACCKCTKLTNETVRAYADAAATSSKIVVLTNPCRIPDTDLAETVEFVAKGKNGAGANGGSLAQRKTLWFVSDKTNIDVHAGAFC